MLEKLSLRYAQFLSDRGIIRQEDVEIQAYGFLALLFHIVNYGTIFIAAAITKNAVETLVFYIFYIPIRNIVGGWHAKTPLRCGIIGFCFWVITILTYKLCTPLVSNGFVILVIDLLLSISVLVFFILDKSIKMQRKLIAFALVVVEIGAAVVFLYTPYVSFIIISTLASLQNFIFYIIKKRA